MNSDPLDFADCTCANLRKAARTVTQAYDAALKPLGLKTTQFTLLATIDKAGELPLVKLAEVLVMERTTLTRNLKPLQAAGYIEIRRGTDQRVRHIGLTPAGDEMLAQACPAWEAVQTRIVKGLGTPNWQVLMQSLMSTIETVHGR